jgi:Integrase zinc binding domain
MKEFDESKGKTLRSSEWSKADRLWRFHDHIHAPLITDLHHWITKLHHDLHIAGHAGQWKMLELLMQSYWWPNMLGSTARPVTCAYKPRLRNRSLLVSFYHSSSPNTLGMSQALISLSNSLIRMGLTQPWLWWIQSANGVTSSLLTPLLWTWALPSCTFSMCGSSMAVRATLQSAQIT